MGRILLAGLTGLALAAATTTAIMAQDAAGPGQPVPGVRMGLSSAGAQIFSDHCGACHTPEGGLSADARAPSMETLRQYPPERIYAALTNGLMQVQGAAMEDRDRREVSEWLSARYLGAAGAGDAASMANRCAPAGFALAGPSWNGWSAAPGNRRAQSADQAGLTAADLPGLKLKWAFGLPGGAQAFSEPAVAGGRVFVGSDSGQVYAIDAKTGCVHWSFLADAAVRTAPIVAALPNGPAVIVGDMKANLYAVDAATGQPVWRARMDDQPLARITGTPALQGRRLYVPVASNEEGQGRLPGMECCRHRGSVVAVELATGRQVWKTYMQPEAQLQGTDPTTGRRLWGPAGGGVWATPTVDAKRGLVYASTGDAFRAPAGALTDAIVALDMDTGAVRWAHQETPGDIWLLLCDRGGYACPTPNGPDVDFASSAMLVPTAGGQEVLVAGHKGGGAVAIDPDAEGAVVWRKALATRPITNNGDILFGGAAAGQRVYFGLQMSGAVTALDPATGRQLWTHALPVKAGWKGHPGPGAALTAIPGAVFVPGWDGVLHALSAEDGRELWTYDTARDFQGVNGVAAKGGSMGAPGAVVADGMVFVGSGYVGTGNGMPGNVVLAFGK